MPNWSDYYDEVERKTKVMITKEYESLQQKEVLEYHECEMEHHNQKIITICRLFDDGDETYWWAMKIPTITYFVEIVCCPFCGKDLSVTTLK
jgi:hypothetical protein